MKFSRSLFNKSAAIRVIFLFILIFKSFTGVSADHRISVYTEDFYPLSYVDQDSVTGYATDLVIAVLEEANLSYDIRLVPWVRVVRALDSDANVLAFSMSRTKDREDKYHWVGEIIPLNYSLYGLKRKSNTLPRTLESAKTSRISVNRGDIAQIYLNSLGFKNLVLVKDDERSLHMLVRDRIDLFPYGEIGINAFVEHHGFEKDDIVKKISLEEISTSAYMALSLGTAPTVVARIQQAYKNIRKNGTYDRIMQQLLSDAER